MWGVKWGKMAGLPDLITVAQYRQLPDDGITVYQLHHGEVVAVSHPKPWHWRFQRRLVGLLEPRLPQFVVGMELAFRAVPEFDLRAADERAHGGSEFERQAAQLREFLGLA